MGQLQLSHTVGGNAYSESSLAILYKVEHTLILQSSRPTPRYLPREMKICVYLKKKTT